MAEKSNELPAEMLRRLQADLGDLTLDVRKIEMGIGHLETQVADLSKRMDRRDEVMEGMLRRHDLRNSAPA